MEHRKKYQDRLGRVLHRIADDERRATRLADFKENWPTQTGFSKQLGSLEFRHTSPEIQNNSSFSLTISPVSCDRPANISKPAALEMAQEFSRPEASPLLGAGLAALPVFEVAAAETSRGEGSAPAPLRAVRPALPISLPMSGALWPTGQPMAAPAAGSAKLPPFEMAAADSPFDAPSAYAMPAEICAPAAAEQRISTTACAPRLASVSTGVLPAFALAPVQAALQPPARSERPAQVEAAVTAGPAPVHAPCDPAPRLESVRAAALPRFALAPAEAPQADTRTAAVMKPAALCEICAPLPEAQPAVGGTEHRGEPRWQWPAALVAFPAIPSAAELAATPAPHLESAFAPTPAAQALEMPLASTLQSTPYESRIAVQMPAGPGRILAGATVPLALAAATRGGEPQVSPAAPVAALECESPRLEAVRLPDSVREIGAPVFRIAPPAGHQPVAVESFPSVEFAAVPQLARIALCYPEFRIASQAVAPAVGEAGLRQPAVPAAAAEASASSVPLDLLLGGQVASPQHRLSASTATAIPQAGMRPLEFFCKCATSAPTLNLGWMMPAQRLSRPRMQIGAALEIAEQAPAPPPRNKNAAAEVFEIPGARKRPAWVREIAKPLAACFLVGAFLWAVAATVHVASRTAAVNRDVATLLQTEEDAPAASESAAPPQAAAPAPEQGGLMARIRGVVASRAASQITETFREGMGAWGAGRKSAPAGWSHSPEGYVRPAAFAMFRPSQTYRDYRMEFFGEIEQKGLSWAVRATDPKNYYAMKFRVVEPGLRPVVAIEHYPVVGGRKGHRTQVPLPELMFHNNTPYRVEVAVRGDRITTSIEGQQVDTWIDDTLPKGGVGFFADAGERARLYWVKVAKNEDFLGRICAYISGGGDRPASAGLWPGNGAPSGTPYAPAWPDGHAPVAVATVFAFRGSSQKRRRSEPWSL